MFGIERRGKTDVDAVHGCNGLKREAEERHVNHCHPPQPSMSFFSSSPEHAIVTAIIIIELIVIRRDQFATISSGAVACRSAVRC